MDALIYVAQHSAEVVAPLSAILCGVTAVLVGWFVYNELPEK